MLTKGTTEKETINNKEKKIRRLILWKCVNLFLQSSQGHVQSSHGRSDKTTRTTLGQNYSSYHHCWMPKLQTVFFNIEMPYSPLPSGGEGSRKLFFSLSNIVRWDSSLSHWNRHLLFMCGFLFFCWQFLHQHYHIYADLIPYSHPWYPIKHNFWPGDLLCTNNNYFHRIHWIIFISLHSNVPAV